MDTLRLGNSGDLKVRHCTDTLQSGTAKDTLGLARQGPPTISEEEIGAATNATALTVAMVTAIASPAPAPLLRGSNYHEHDAGTHHHHRRRSPARRCWHRHGRLAFTCSSSKSKGSGADVTVPCWQTGGQHARWQSHPGNCGIDVQEEGRGGDL